MVNITSLIGCLCKLTSNTQPREITQIVNTSSDIWLNSTSFLLLKVQESICYHSCSQLNFLDVSGHVEFQIIQAAIVVLLVLKVLHINTMLGKWQSQCFGKENQQNNSSNCTLHVL